MRRTRWSSHALSLTLVTLLGVFLLYPIWLTVEGGFRSIDGESFTLFHLKSVFTTPRLLWGLLNSLAIAACTTALCLLIGVPLAMLTARYDFRGKALFGALILAPLILPPFVGAIGLHHLLGRNGAVNTLLMHAGLIDTGIDFIGRGGFWAVVILEALHLYPILYLNAAAALANIDPSLEEAAENLGASAWRRFRTIVLPMMRPGLFAGATIVFIWSFTELGTPLMFEYHHVTPVQIFNGIREMNAKAEPYALTVVMLASAVLLYAGGRLCFGRRGEAMSGKASRHAVLPRLRGMKGLLAGAAFAGVILLAALPHAGVILASIAESGAWYRSVVPQSITFRHYENALGHPLAIGSIRNSLLLASAAVLVDIVLGLAIAHLLVRTRAWGRSVLDALAMLPLAVPGLVMAFGYVALTLRWPCAGSMPRWMASLLDPVLPQSWFDWLNHAPLSGWADVLGADPNPVPLLIIAYAVRRLPYVVRSAAAGLEQTPRELEEASLNLGAGRFRTLRAITLPLIAANLVAGALLAFSFAMLEVSDSLILAQREQHFPITKAIYVLVHRLGDGEHIASAMGVWGMALLTVTLVGAAMLMGRRMGAVFRA